MTLQDFFTDVACRDDKQKTIEWLRHHGLLANEMMCPVCQKKMRQQTVVRSNEGVKWRCRNRECRRTLNIRKGSFFEASHITLERLMTIIFLWGYDLSHWQITEHSEVSDISLMHRLRDLCSWDLTANHQQVGGSRRVVAIGETLIVKRKTENSKGLSSPEEWIFGGVDLTTNDFFLELVPDREVATVFPVIVRNIALDSTIWSDRRYESISSLGYEHQPLDYAENCDVKGCDMIEARLTACKDSFKRKYGVPREYLSSYLDEYVWKCKRERGRVFSDIISVIRMRHPV